MACVFTYSVLENGIPALRHDWIWPADTPGLIQHFSQLGSGWFASGMGFSNPYPMTYFIVWPLAVCAVIFGSFVTLVVQLLLIVATSWLAARSLSARFGLHWVDGVLIAAFLLFNPWTFGKIVSGHLTQTMACMAFAVVLNESLQREPERRRLLWAVVGTALQTQFFLIAFALCLIRITRSEARRAALAGVLVFSPSIVGIAGDSGDLLQLQHWPFAIAFENGQSVRLSEGVFLRGDFTHYSVHPLDGLAVAAIAVVLAICVFVFIARRTITAYGSGFAAIAALVVAGGTTGVLGPLWRWCILHAPIVGVYRELYDLVGIAAAAYAVLMAIALNASKFARPAAALACLLLSICWLLYPPARFFVTASALPPPGPLLSMRSRYAVMPPFQPLAYRNTGAGSDPLYVGLSATRAPVNWLLPQYPANAALAKYWQTGDSRDLRRLGVTLIECRPGFSVAGAAAVYYHVAQNLRPCPSNEVAIDDAAPIVALQSTTAVCTLCSAIGAGNRFYGDLPGGSSTFFPVPALREFADPNRGWIDASLEFANEPDLAQPLGGAYTTQSRQDLALHSGPYALADVHGVLRDPDGALISAGTRGYQWIRLRGSTVRCFGACAIAGTGAPPAAALDGPVQPAVAVKYSEPFPWLLLVDLDGKSSGTLRLLQNYAPSWTAVTYPGVHSLAHVRLDAALNGWIAGPQTPAHVILFNAVAVAQFCAELLGFFVLALLLATSIRTFSRFSNRRL